MKKSPFFQALLWLMPTGIEIATYATLAAVTLAVSNIGVVKNLFMLEGDFNIYHLALESLEGLLTALVGQQVAANIVTGVFWGIVGMLIYVFLWLSGNFSKEIGNDLAATTYIHSKGVDTFSPLKHFVFRIIFQICIAVVLVFYINLLVRVLLPLWTTEYSSLAPNWPNLRYIRDAILAFISQILGLHIFTVLVRLLTLRKRVFGDL